MADTKALRKRHFTIYGELETEYEAYQRPKAEQIRDFLWPEGARFKGDDDTQNDGSRKDENIIDPTGSLAHRTLVAGLYSSIASPAAEWVRYSIEDDALKEIQAVKLYFDRVTKRILTDLANSNFYTSMEFVYASISAFSTAAIHVDADFDKIFNFTSFMTGEYYLDNDDKGVAGAIYRRLKMRARNVIEKFGEENVSQKVKDKMAGDKAGSEWIEILHVMEKNMDRDTTKLDSKNKPYLSTYWEMIGDEDSKPLRESGYDTKPFSAGRWSAAGNRSYGVDSPGEMALASILELQQLKTDYLMAVGKQVEMPMQVPANLGDVSINSGANGITRVNNVGGQGPGITPLYEVKIELNALLLEIQELQKQINTAFFTNLFFLLIDQKREETATEARIKKQEQLSLLGPIVERMHPEVLNDLMERAYVIEEEMGRLPEPPVEIRGQKIKIEITSLISQAQRLTALVPIEETINTVIGLMAGWPEVRDKVNADQIVDIVANIRGIPADAINSDEIVAAIRKDRLAAVEEEKRQAQADATVDNAQKLSQTPVGGNTALTALAGGA